MKNELKILSLILSLVLLLCACNITFTNDISGQALLFRNTDEYETLEDIPEFDGKTPYVILNDNQPDFSESDIVTQSYEYYSPLDSLGRCGVVMACIGTDIMPTEERDAIGMIKPTGWHTVKYDNVDGKYLYNRCHLIGYQLTGENANELNLITGTRYLNVEGMLPFENLIAEYVQETENHVIYRVTPIFEGNNLLSSGVQIEAKSVEDEGKGICFNVYCYNSQPDIIINYTNGDSFYDSGKSNTNSDKIVSTEYVLNTSSKKFHLSDCGSVSTIKDSNKKTSTKSRDELMNEGYTPCKQCNP